MSVYENANPSGYFASHLTRVKGDMAVFLKTTRD